MKRILRSFFMIINYKTIIITVLSLASTYLCYHYNLTANFPDMLVGVAIVFPVVFSINSAFTRRENALKQFADFKGHAIALYYATRDWPTNDGEEVSKQTQTILEGMFISLQKILKEPSKEVSHTLEMDFYEVFSRLSSLTKELRTKGIQSGEISRMNQYISKMMIAFDNMMVVHHYRTPITLRAYSKVFLYIFPIIYGPYFANTFKTYSANLGYVMPILYSFILVSLDNIQDHLENPFDDIGEDDIRINEKEIISLMH